MTGALLGVGGSFRAVVRLVKGVSPASLADALPDTAYSLGASGAIVTQNSTGLMWQRCAVGQAWNGSACSGTATSYTLTQAKVLTSTLGGYSDWRLPLAEEFATMTDFAKIASESTPSDSVLWINSNMIPTVITQDPDSYKFWSSTTFASSFNFNWVMDATKGYMSTLYGVGADNTASVRLVRKGTVVSAGPAVTMTSGWNLVGNGTAASIALAGHAILANKDAVTTVWKWKNGGWQFFAPSMTSAELQTYAMSKSYAVLTDIAPGEGFWVNVKATTAQTLNLPSGANVAATSLATGLPVGWSLLGIGESKTPAEANAALGGNLTTLWAWDANPTNPKWFFFAPSQTASDLAAYATQKGYLNFATNNTKLGMGMGFWVNKAQ